MVPSDSAVVSLFSLLVLHLNKLLSLLDQLSLLSGVLPLWWSSDSRDGLLGTSILFVQSVKYLRISNWVIAVTDIVLGLLKWLNLRF